MSQKKWKESGQNDKVKICRQNHSGIRRFGFFPNDSKWGEFFAEMVLQIRVFIWRSINYLFFTWILRICLCRLWIRPKCWCFCHFFHRTPGVPWIAVRPSTTSWIPFFGWTGFCAIRPLTNVWKIRTKLHLSGFKRHFDLLQGEIVNSGGTKLKGKYSLKLIWFFQLF